MYNAKKLDLVNDSFSWDIYKKIKYMSRLLKSYLEYLYELI